MKTIAIMGIIILCGGVVSLASFYLDSENTGGKYSLRELGEKYPTVIDLNCGVQSGELEYNKLPARAKQVLENFTQSDSILNIDCKKDKKYLPDGYTPNELIDNMP